MKLTIGKDENLVAQVEMLLNMAQRGDVDVTIGMDESVYRDDDFLQYLIVETFRMTILRKEAYFHLAELYRKLNLYDNKRLLTMLRENKKGAQVKSDERYDGAVNSSFSKAIYEDIIGIAAEELIKNGNPFVKDLLYKAVKLYADNLVLAAKFVLDACVEVCKVRFDNASKEDADEKTISLAYNDYYFIKQREMKSDGLFTSGLTRYAKGNLYKDKEYLALADRTMKNICEYLDVPNQQAVFSLIRGSLAYDHTDEPDEKAALFTEMADLFADGLLFNNFYNGLVGGTAPESTDSYLKNIFTKTLNSTVMDIMYENDLENFADVEVEEIPAFLTKMMFILYEDALLHAISDLLVNYYKNFNFDKVDKMETIKTLNHDLYVAQRQVADLNVRLTKQKERADALDKKLRSKDKDIERGYLDQIHKLEKQNDLLSDEKATLEEKLKLQEEYIKMLEMPEEQEVEETIDYAKLTGKFLFVGGRIETINELKKVFPTSIFTSNETDNVNMEHVDYIVMFTKFMNHALFYRYITVAREMGIKIIYCANNNIDMILKHIQKEVK